MASPEKYLDIENSEEAAAWLEAFEARCTIKKLKGKLEDNMLEKTDLFIATCGLKALQKIKYLLKPESAAEVEFDTIKKTITKGTTGYRRKDKVL